jgi:hypothetical protein
MKINQQEIIKMLEEESNADVKFKKDLSSVMLNGNFTKKELLMIISAFD